MILKEFQIDAINETAEYIRDFLIKKEQGKASSKVSDVVLKSPTGSGKTIMAAEILRNLADFFEAHHYVIIWAAPNKLHEQSLNKLSDRLQDTEYQLINVDSMGSGALTRNTVLFTNWEKLFKQDKDGEWANKVVRKGEDGKNLQDVLDATRAAGLGVILIVDESHQTFYGPNSQALVHEVIKPDLVFEISATPKAVSTGGDYHMTEVDFADVIESELIKKEVYLNNEIAKNINDSSNSVEVVIKAALDKRDELAKIYQEQGININPLLLIQLPNTSKETMSALDLQDKDIIENILTSRGLRYSNGELAIWLSDDKKNLENIVKPTSQVKVLIFKQAIALGWDCPRAQVMAMLRDTKSEVFRIQTVGRILRMPEAKHYAEDALNKAYVYTDLPDITIAPDDTDAKNLIKTQFSYRREDISNIALPSVFIHRTDYGDLRADFKPILDNILDQTFDVDDSMIIGEERYNKIDEKLELYDSELTAPIIADAIIENLDSYEVSEYETLKVNMDAANIERIFNTVLKGFTGQFKNWARTKSVVCGTLYSWFHKANIDIEQVQKLLACSTVNQEIFSQIFDRALDAYEDVYREEMKRRRARELEELTFRIPDVDQFNENYLITSSPNNAMVLYYRKKNAPSTEEKFEDMLNSSKQIEWWYKNGEKMERYFAIPFFELNERKRTVRRAFYPDYIIKYNDGSIGIYDTKAGFTADNEHVRQKANALQDFIKRNANLNLKGGIINVKNNNFYLQDSPDYDENGEWVLFNI
ncbi:DEAD/DEAH box helicase family protein [Candidatus Saccharibacteria bacterium]|nr:DEAD/DEAH box helicase family protein [Candidatus Saccharibacteria bacterium]